MSNWLTGIVSIRDCEKENIKLTLTIASLAVYLHSLGLAGFVCSVTVAWKHLRKGPSTVER